MHAIEIAADGGLRFGVASMYERISTDLRPTEEDVILQVDAIGDTINFWAWRVGETMPELPLLTRTDNQLPTGIAGVYYTPSSPPQVTSGTAVYRYVHVANTHFGAPAEVPGSCPRIEGEISSLRRSFQPPAAGGWTIFRSCASRAICRGRIHRFSQWDVVGTGADACDRTKNICQGLRFFPDAEQSFRVTDLKSQRWRRPQQFRGRPSLTGVRVPGGRWP